MAFVEALQPNVFEALCDSVTSAAGHKMKRIKKSVDRSLRFLDQTIAQRSKVYTSSVQKTAVILICITAFKFNAGCKWLLFAGCACRRRCS